MTAPANFIDELTCRGALQDSTLMLPHPPPESEKEAWQRLSKHIESLPLSQVPGLLTLQTTSRTE